MTEKIPTISKIRIETVDYNIKDEELADKLITLLPENIEEKSAKLIAEEQSSDE